MLGFVLDAELVLVDSDLADDQDRPAVVLAGIRQDRGEIGRTARLQLRVAGRREGRKESQDSHEGHARRDNDAACLCSCGSVRAHFS